MPAPGWTGDPYPGKNVGSAEFTLSEAMIADYYGGLAIPAPAEPAPVPSMAICCGENMLSQLAHPENNHGNLWLRQAWDFLRPARAGERYRATTTVLDIFPRRARSIVLTRTDIADAGGDLIAQGRHHQSFVPDQRTGMVPLADPSKKPGARGYTRPSGAPLGTFERAISLEMCGQFFHGNRNYHTDKQASNELGFEEVVVGGWMTISAAAEVAQEHFGASWWTNGRFACKFTNIVWPGDTIRASGVATGPHPDDRSRESVALWVEKADGATVLTAAASARLP